MAANNDFRWVRCIVPSMALYSNHLTSVSLWMAAVSLLGNWGVSFGRMDDGDRGDIRILTSRIDK